ncbi:MAG TPA: hypothetical protein VEZ55_08010 [Chitinophagaceae bacterium]|jgi:hypothetical protein|nr:hypothetical protein [Chitinophagaceae bacterium]
MISTETDQEVDLWEAWIDLESSESIDCPMLYVVGEVFTKSILLRPVFRKRESNVPDILVLEILPGVSSEEGVTCEISYAEPILNLLQYQSIQIFSGDRLVATISEIDIIS